MIPQHPQDHLAAINDRISALDLTLCNAAHCHLLFSPPPFLTCFTSIPLSFRCAALCSLTRATRDRVRRCTRWPRTWILPTISQRPLVGCVLVSSTYPHILSSPVPSHHISVERIYILYHTIPYRPATPSHRTSDIMLLCFTSHYASFVSPPSPLTDSHSTLSDTNNPHFSWHYHAISM